MAYIPVDQRQKTTGSGSTSKSYVPVSERVNTQVPAGPTPDLRINVSTKIKTSTPTVIRPSTEPLAKRYEVGGVDVTDRVPVKPSAPDIARQNAVISQAPQDESLLGKFMRSPAPEPLKTVFRSIHDSFYGKGQEVDVTGQSTEDRGLLGFGMPAISKSDNQKVTEVINRLRKEDPTISEQRASEIAISYIKPGIKNTGNMLDRENVRVQQEEKLATLNLNERERAVLRKTGILNTLNTGLDALNFTGIGSTVEKSAAKIIARTTEEVLIKKTLQEEIPKLSDDAASSFAKILRNVNKEEDVQQVLNKINYGLNKAGAKGVLEPEVSELASGRSYIPVKERRAVKNEPIFEGFTDLSTNVLSKLEGRSTVSKQFISDLTSGPELKQVERELIRSVLESYPENKPIPVKEFADKVKAELLPLERSTTNDIENTGEGDTTQYESITLPDEVRGPVANYSEHVYESPVKTSAGGVHFDQEINPGYFGHTRVEDMAPEGFKNPTLGKGKGLADMEEAMQKARDEGTTRRIIEVQSDLYQKGGLETEAARRDYYTPGELVEYKGKQYEVVTSLDGRKMLRLKGLETPVMTSDTKRLRDDVQKELAPLKQYSNPTAHFRMVREEIKQAAIDGKTKLQFPTGETAMKIEGLGDNSHWYDSAAVEKIKREGPREGMGGLQTLNRDAKLDPMTMKVGQEVTEGTSGIKWVITDVLGDGKFKAVPKKTAEMNGVLKGASQQISEWANRNNLSETFDISGKVDSNNPIYKFYEKDLGKYLTSKYGAKIITDSQGVKWFELDVKPGVANKPVMAFKKGKGSIDVPTEQAKKIIRRYFSQGEMQVLFRKELGGKYMGMIEISQAFSKIKLLEKGGLVSEHTTYHELFHGLFNLRFTKSERLAAVAKIENSPALRTYIQAKYSHYPKNERIEEYLADDFANYAAGPKAYKGVLRNIWEKLMDYVRGLIRKFLKLGEVYDQAEAMKIKEANGGGLSRADQTVQPGSGLGRQTPKYPSGNARPLGNPQSVNKTAIQSAGASVSRSGSEEVGSLIKYKINPDKRQTGVGDLRNAGPDNIEKIKVALAEEKVILEGQKQLLAINPAKDLAKYENKRTGELPEVIGEGTGFGKSGDDIVTQLGFSDSEEARESYQEYKRIKKNYQERLALYKENKKKYDRLIASAESADKFLNTQEILPSTVNGEELSDLNPSSANQTSNEKFGATDKALPTKVQPSPVKLSQRGGLGEVVSYPSGKTGVLRNQSLNPRVLTGESGPEHPTLGSGEPTGIEKQAELQSLLQSLEGQRESRLESKYFADTSSLIDMVQEMQTPVKKKVNILDYIRTPDRVLKKIGLGAEAQLLRRQYDKYLEELPKNIEKITTWSKRVPGKDASKRIFQNLDGQPVALYGEEASVAEEIKTWLKEWADRLELPKSNRISNYITHIFEKNFIQKEFPEELAKIIIDKIPGSVYDPFLQKRLGKMGYIEDAWRALDAYVKRATRKYHMDPALANLEDAASSLEESQWDYVKSLADRINLRPTKWDVRFDNFFKSVPLLGYKLGQRPTALISRVMRQMVYRGTLGLNITSALKNLSQGANTYAKLGEKYTAIGYVKLFSNLYNKELEEVGVLRQGFIQDRALNATLKFWEKTDKGLFFMFEMAERINRAAAYYGAKSKALNMGMDELKAIEYAKKIVRDTQFQFGSVDTPLALQSDVAKVIGQFQSYTTKQTEFLLEMVANKEYAGITRYVLMGLAFVFLVGESLGMEPEDLIPSFRFGMPPGVKAIKDVYDTATFAKDQYGKVPTFKQRGKQFANDAMLLVPGSVQAKKILKGNILGSKKEGKKNPLGPKMPEFPKLPPLPKFPKPPKLPEFPEF
jgi:hypothetical protein